MPRPSVQEAAWRLGIEGGAFGVWDLDPRFDRVHYSPAWKARLGFSSADVSEATSFWRCRVHPEDFEPMLHALQLHLDGSAPAYEARFRMRSNGSGYRLLLSRGRVVERGAQGQPLRMVGALVDLSQRPVTPARHGLPSDAAGQQAVPERTPFHALLVGACAQAGDAASIGTAGHGVRRLLDQTDDLLDWAVRRAGGAVTA